MRDRYQRKIEYLRLSITDRCQLRCQYCMPEEGVEWTPLDKMLNTNEIKEIVSTFAKLGVSKLKLTGGEPLLFPGIIDLVQDLKTINGIEEITLTTNGIGLESMVDELVKAGLDGVNISLDTLKGSRYTLMTRKNQLDKVLRGIDKAANSNLKVKINCVLISELNKDELIDIAELAKDKPIHIRFIELMPVGSEKAFSGVSEEEVCEVLRKFYGSFKSVNEKLGNGPAHYVEIDGFKGKIGFISAISNHFCNTCNRVRVTSDGFLKTCLYFNKGINLKTAIKNNDLETQIIEALKLKPKQHHFNNFIEDQEREQKSMVQIGG